MDDGSEGIIKLEKLRVIDRLRFITLQQTALTRNFRLTE